MTAVAVGAVMIEKRFTLSRAVPGPDSCFSLEPEEFAAMVREVRTAEQALGAVSHAPSDREMRSRALRVRSLL